MSRKKLIASANRLQKYSKQTLIELVTELRERFADYSKELVEQEKTFNNLRNALLKANAELNDQRKKNRELMKLVPSKDLQKYLDR